MLVATTRGHAPVFSCSDGLEHPVNSNAMFRWHCYLHFTSRCRRNGSDRVARTFGPTSMCSTDTVTSPAARTYKGHHKLGVGRSCRTMVTSCHGHSLDPEWPTSGLTSGEPMSGRPPYAIFIYFSPCFCSRCPPPKFYSPTAQFIFLEIRVSRQLTHSVNPSMLSH